jgi:hypothetical protein
VIFLNNVHRAVVDAELELYITGAAEHGYNIIADLLRGLCAIFALNEGFVGPQKQCPSPSLGE